MRLAGNQQHTNTLLHVLSALLRRTSVPPQSKPWKNTWIQVFVQLMLCGTRILVLKVWQALPACLKCSVTVRIGRTLAATCISQTLCACLFSPHNTSTPQAPQYKPKKDTYKGDEYKDDKYFEGKKYEKDYSYKKDDHYKNDKYDKEDYHKKDSYEKERYHKEKEDYYKDSKYDK
jgi:hypothetical protein